MYVDPLTEKMTQRMAICIEIYSKIGGNPKTQRGRLHVLEESTVVYNL